ncbi:MAG: hypothetical protein DRJ65_00115 [Acidobacteria bacterium]|nr:MAG: hypothetical protein DRJ65_00115 [Acidobacteriota bacterium]
MYLTHEIRELLRENAGRGLFAVSIEHSSGTLRYCTGDRSVEISSEWFTPRGMSLPKLNIATGDTSARIAIADHPEDPEALERLHYASRFSGGLMWWHFLVWADDGSGWNEVYSHAWTIKQCTKSERVAEFEFILSGATGTYPRAGLEVIGRGCGLTYGNALCGGTTGTYKSCDGSMADCVLRGREASYRGAVLAPEPGHEIEFFYREASYGVGSTYYVPPPPPGGEDHGNTGSDTANKPVINRPSDAVSDGDTADVFGGWINPGQTEAM